MSDELNLLPDPPMRASISTGCRLVREDGSCGSTGVCTRPSRRIVSTGTRLDLYHSALVVTVPSGRFVIENSWPLPDRNGATRGVAVEGPVGNRRLARFQSFRYEIRRWRNGVIADIAEAVNSPQRLSIDEEIAYRLLELVERVPPLGMGTR